MGVQQLTSILRSASASSKEDTLISLTNYLSSYIGVRELDLTSATSVVTAGRVRSRRRQRRVDYARTQTNWRKHQARCVKNILDDNPDNEVLPSKNVMIAFWKNIFERRNSISPNFEDNLQESDVDILNPITPDEIRKVKMPLSTSPGPDGISPKQLRGIPAEILSYIYNLVLYCGYWPRPLRISRTIFLAKKQGASSPGDFRPISIASIFVRHLHCILAKRLASQVNLDPRQRGFRASDGCAENITLLDLLIKHSHAKYSSCYMMILDVAKAFDSVSHNAIYETLRVAGISGSFIRYLTTFYQTSRTRLMCKDWCSDEIHPQQGVKQGDPLSPILFNLVMDRVLKSLPTSLGVNLGSKRVNSLAFADDLILCASTAPGLQQLVDTTCKVLASCGLSTNPAKCLSVSIKGQPKQKNSVITEKTFIIDNREVPIVRRSQEWRYLGVRFSPDGRCKVDVIQQLDVKLERLTKAPLKPQQRLHALRTYLVPQFLHELTLGSVYTSYLMKVDCKIRYAVRKWLSLPLDVPNAFLYASVQDGGLGIPSLRWQAPLVRRNRLSGLVLPNLEGNFVADEFLLNELEKANNKLKTNGLLLTSKSVLQKYWSERLYSSVDGNGLREASHCPQTHRWIRDPSRFLSGRDFVQCVRLRINALPTLSRTSRGRLAKDRTCRAGCNGPETLNHVVQQCFYTRRYRSDRHNYVVEGLSKRLTKRGFVCEVEPNISTSEGIRKPDLVAVSGNRVNVLDVQIVTDSISLAVANRTKEDKYNTSSVREALVSRYGSKDIFFGGVTLNWRGVWSKDSFEKLVARNLLRISDGAVFSTRVAVGSCISFKLFSQMVFRRTGVG